MVFSFSSSSAKRLTTLVGWIHKNFLWLLVASYLLAAFLPGPGLAIRNLSLTPPTGNKVTAPLLLLALLLFCAASVVRWSQVRNLLQHPGILLVGLVAIWIVPGILVSLLGWFLPSMLGEYVTNGMLVGLALVAAMPVANSSVAWSQNAQGNIALSLGLVVLTIILSPLATPQLLNAMGFVLSKQETAQCEALVTKFSGAFFMVWVILPSLAGGIVNRLAGPRRIEKARGTLRLVSAITLLTLNYTNASLAMPKVLNNEGAIAVVVSAVLAILLSVTGMLSAWYLSRWLKLGDESRVAFVFGFSMKHTGLALVLAGEVLETEPRVILMIVIATLLQHIIAGVADWFLARQARKQSDT